jgi:hypothetical protein
VTYQETRRTSNNDFISSYTYSYVLGEGGYLQRQIIASGNGNGTTNINYNYRDEINYTTSSSGSTYVYIYDLNGQIITKSVSGTGLEREQQVFVGGTLIGNKRTDPNGAVTMNFGFDYTPISKAYPNITPGQYVVRAGDTLQSIAQAVYGDSSRWYIIADANNLSATSALPENLSLKIPNTVTNASNTSDTFRPYSPADVIGDLTPALPKPRKKHSKTFTTILVAVVAVVATVYGAGVIASGAFGSGLWWGRVSNTQLTATAVTQMLRARPGRVTFWSMQDWMCRRLSLPALPVRL